MGRQNIAPMGIYLVTPWELQIDGRGVGVTPPNDLHCSNPLPTN